MNSRLNHFLIAATLTGCLAAQGFTFSKVADTNTPVPNGTGNFASFGGMTSVDSNGDVAFAENNGTVNKGIYLSGSGGITRVADLNTAIPGGTDNFTTFATFGNGIESGRLAFRGNGPDSQAGIYAYSSGNLSKIVDTNTAIPGGTGNFTSFGTAYVDAMNYAFIGSGASGQQALCVTDGTTVTRIADKASTVPDIGGTYGWSSQVGFDAGNLAFWSFISGGTNPGGIVGGYTSGGGLVTLASTATAVPGAGTNFTGFTSPVDLSGTTVAFRGNYTGGHGIFTVDLSGGAVTTIADPSTAVPGGTGNFSQVQDPNIVNGAIVFRGTFDGGSGIYLYQGSSLQKIIDTSDTLDGKDILLFGLSENAFADGHLAFSVFFTDSSSGIYRTEVSSAPAITDFSSWQQAKFTAPELADPSKSGPNAIYGSDGLANLLKYALGLEPKVNVTAGLPALGEDSTHWTYTYTRPETTTDVTYSVEVSDNLSDWTDEGVIHEMVSSTEGIETWQGRYPTSSATSLFMHLKVSIAGDPQ